MGIFGAHQKGKQQTKHAPQQGQIGQYPLLPVRKPGHAPAALPQLGHKGQSHRGGHQAQQPELPQPHRKAVDHRQKAAAVQNGEQRFQPHSLGAEIAGEKGPGQHQIQSHAAEIGRHGGQAGASGPGDKQIDSQAEQTDDLPPARSGTGGKGNMRHGQFLLVRRYKAADVGVIYSDYTMKGPRNDRIRHSFSAAPFRGSKKAGPRLAAKGRAAGRSPAKRPFTWNGQPAAPGTGWWRRWAK